MVLLYNFKVLLDFHNCFILIVYWIILFDERLIHMRRGMAFGSKYNKKIKRNRALIKDNISFFCMSAPAMLLVLVFSYLPMFGLIIAFKDYKHNKGIIGSEWAGFKNFEFFFKSNDASRIAINTLYLNFIFIFVGILVAVMVALLLYEVRRRAFVKFYQTTMIFPHFLSMVVVAYIAYAFLNPSFGFVNGIMERLGMEGVSWYTKPAPWPIILIIVNVWKHFGMDSVVYYAALMGVDSEYYEAAEIDGASRIQQIWYISIPSLVPIMTILSILAVGRIFRADFGLFYQVTMDSGALYSTTDVIDTYVFRALRQLGDIGMSSAVGLFQSVVGFVLVLMTNAIVSKIDKENALF